MPRIQEGKIQEGKLQERKMLTNKMLPFMRGVCCEDARNYYVAIVVIFNACIIITQHTHAMHFPHAGVEPSIITPSIITLNLVDEWRITI